MTETFIALFARDLNRLAREIDAYADETVLWQTAPGINNSAGNLCLHLLGNLNAYIGSTLGQSGYVRDREFEFSAKNVPKAELLAEIDAVSQVVTTILPTVTAVQLNALYPTEVLGYPITVHYFLTHLVGHLNYHLGQINYHRRLLTGGSRTSFVNQ